MEGLVVPDGLYHLHNLAMRNLVVCTSNLTREKKDKIRQLVNFMGGYFSEPLMEDCTHLISDSVTSEKYEHSARKGRKIMHIDWVLNVWQKTQGKAVNIVATDEQFDSFKLPIFYNLCLTTTGISVADRKQIQQLVEENGGAFSASFTSKVSMLLMEQSVIGCEKHKAAVKLKKYCLRPSWVMDSVANGYAMPLDDYTVHNPQVMKASTPSKSLAVNASRFNPDNTQLSDISRVTSFRDTFSLNETSTSMMQRRSMMPAVEYKQALAKVTLPAAKKVGNVLDGFNFYLSGFVADELQLLGKVLSALGGTKLDAMSEQVSHVLVGAPDAKLFTELDNNNVEPVVLKMEWLARVVEGKKLVPEGDYEVERTVKPKSVPAASPASKKAMKSMSGVFKRPDIPKLKLDMKERDEELELVSQYLEAGCNVSEASESHLNPFLDGKTVFVCGYSDHVKSTETINELERLGATLVDADYHQEIDYVVTPFVCLSSFNSGVKRWKHIVSDIWLEQSAEAGKCVDVEFFHQPLIPPAKEFLTGENFVVSNYTGAARTFIKELVKVLGGSHSEELNRSRKPILISPTAEGKKFVGAKAWNFSVLTADWLIESMKQKTRVDETPFLVGGTNASAKNHTESVPSSQASPQQCFDAHDPPVENFDDNAGPFSIISTPVRRNQNEPTPSPKTPDTPVNPLSISMLVADMPTPQRQITKAALLENQEKNIDSPRKKLLKQLMETPTTKVKKPDDSPLGQPNLPECMREPPFDYSLRPNSSPDAQWFHKRKMEGLDNNYLPRSAAKKTRVEEKQEERTVRKFRWNGHDNR